MAAKPKKRPVSPYIAGVGASAGGLDALEALFEGMPEKLGIAFVVVQHLSPDFKSHMVELLGRKTKLPVHYAEDGLEVKANNLYLIPPNKEMVISDGRLLLSERDADSSSPHPIDVFFRSLAHDAGRKAIGIVLSGTGSDGSDGVKDIAESGGLVLGQTVASAAFDGMPLNAQATGAVHVILPPDGMPEALERYVTDSLSPQDFAKEDFDVAGEGIERIFQLLRRARGVDFSHYKISTIGRRVQRRMTLKGIDSVDAYCEKLQVDPQELNELFNDMLIGVTRFFRDAKAFQVLETKVVPGLVRHADRESKPLRIWVAGCASGEEAYSIAMIVDEVVAADCPDLEWKVFATDIDEASIRHAAAGVYTESALSEVSDKRRARYFKQDKDGYHIVSELREHLLFAPQNVISDAPFTKMDMVSCRNLLIYFQPSAQRKLLSLFHFALRIKGVLFLGPSETPGSLGDEFETVDSRWNVYSKRRDVRLSPDTRVSGASTLGMPRAAGGDRTAGGAPDVQLLRTYDRLLEKHIPPAVLLTERLEIVHSFAGAEKFLQVKSGRISTNLLDMVPEDLRTPLTGAIQHALRDDKEVTYTGVRSSDRKAPLKICVRPLKDPVSNVTHIVVEFDEQEPKSADVETSVSVDMDEMSRERVRDLESELQFTHENLQATIEELEASNEELQSTNEEMLAANEELQSSNEELQSVNEELYAVNAEHQRKLEELAQANADMDNLLASTNVGVVFLDEDLRIRRFTPEIAKLLDLQRQDIGRSIGASVHRLNVEDVESDCREALKESRTIEQDVTARNGVSYLMRIAPYRTGEESDGVVITLVDVDRLKKAETNLKTYQHMSEQALDGHVLFDENKQILYANAAYAELSGYDVEELQRMSYGDLVARSPSPDSYSSEPGLELILEDHRRKDGTVWPVEVRLSPVGRDAAPKTFATIRDISARVEYERAISLYSRAMDASRNGLAISAASEGFPLTYVNTGFETLTGYSSEEVIGRNCGLLQGEHTDPDSIARIRKALDNDSPLRLTLRNYRKNGEPFWNDLSMSPLVDDSGRVTHWVGIQHDVTDAIDQSIELGQRSAELTSLLQSTSDGIFGIDGQGVCTFVNVATLQMLGYEDRNELLGKNLHELVHHTRPDGSAYAEADCPIVAGLARSESTRIDEDTFWRKDGTALSVEYTSDPIVVDDETYGAVVSFRDVEEKRIRLKLLEDARRDAEAANTAKSEFLAHMSHEIRTPLTAIMGFVDVLQSQIENQKQQGNLRTIKSNVYYLLDIINDILDLSKIEADRIGRDRHSVDLGMLLRELKSVFGLRAEEQGLAFDVSFESPIPKAIVSNVTQLRQILLNLLGNAMKFTDSGRVDLVALVDEQRLELHVRDTGIGMSEETKSRIFEAFTRGREVRPGVGGTGLGLNISRRLAERLGAQLNVESELGEGSNFVLCIPLTADEMSDMSVPDLSIDSRSIEIPKREVSTDALAGSRVLVVDDQPDILNYFASVFEEAGADVLTAGDGRDALRSAANEPDSLDLIVLDMQLPLVSGFDVARKLRENGNDVPIIAVTAGAMKGERRRCLEAGCSEFLAKPVERLGLLEAAERIIDSGHEKLTRVLVVEDHEDSAAAMATILRSHRFEVLTVTSGAEARAAFPGFAPEVCIIDQNLPDITGAELRSSLDGDRTGDRPLYIAASGAAGDEAKFYKSGFDSVFIKPLDMQGLVQTIEQWRR